MRKLNYLVLLLAGTLFLFSCNKDEEASFQAADLVGEWTGEKMTFSFTGDGMDEFTKALLKAFFPPEMPITGLVYHFKDDNTLEAYGSDDPELNGTGTWSLAGKELTITSDDESLTYIVKQLSSSKLELYIRETDSDSMEGMELTIESSMFFNK